MLSGISIGIRTNKFFNKPVYCKGIFTIFNVRLIIYFSNEKTTINSTPVIIICVYIS